MSRTLKWIYKLGWDNSRNSIIRIVERARDFHFNQEQIKAQREYDERDTSFILTPKQHKQRRIALEDLLNELDPERYPDINKFMELMK
ncbi:MAG TPA: hypothetical protein PKV66_00590 [Candidatus Pelethenecus sp.]|nr:hypothetical protein [Candidatus Pelethenecus sp.]